MITIKLDNEYLPNNIKLGASTLNINVPQAGEIAVCEFLLINKNNNDIIWNDLIGKKISLYDDGNLIYGGQIDEPKTMELNRGPNFKTNITCVDWHYFTTRVWLNNAYRRQLISTTIKDMIDDKLADYGIWYDDNSIKESTGFYVAINCDYSKCQDVFNELANLINWQWRIGPDKKFYFNDRTTDIGTPGVIEDTTNYIPSSLEIYRDRSEYRNRQVLKDVKAITDELTEKATPTPDEDNTYIVRFPLNSKPKIYLTDTYPVVYESQLVDPAKVGISGIDSGLTFYWNKESNIITYDQDADIIPPNYVVAVKYFGQYKINVIEEDTAEIARRASIEGTIGIYEEIEDGGNIEGLSIAEDAAQAIINRYGQIAQKIEISSYSFNWEIGQIVDVVLPRKKINSLTSEGNGFLVMEKKINSIGHLVLREYVLIDGEPIGGWVSYFSNFLRGGKSWTLKEDVLVTVPINSNEPIENDGIITLKLIDSLYPGTTLYPSNTLYPGTLLNTAIYND